MKLISKSVEETNKVALDFLNSLGRPQSNEALVVGLFGDLGSGKTTFSQALAKHLGVAETVTSPTFVIEKIYLLKDDRNHLENLKAFEKLIHIDAYRLDSGQELLALDFEEIQKDPKNLILLEWPERVADILPVDMIKINFKFISENKREIEI